MIKVGGHPGSCKLKGAVAPHEVLDPSGELFLDADPRDGFSVRNFQIQTAKIATLSDIVVYGDESVSQADIHAVASGVAFAQADWMERNEIDRESPPFNTFVLSSE